MCGGFVEVKYIVLVDKILGYKPLINFAVDLCKFFNEQDKLARLKILKFYTNLFKRLDAPKYV